VGGKSDDAIRYARAIERRWSGLLEQPVVLSPRDWARIARWHALGVPLEIVEEAMRTAVERSRRRAGSRRLSDLAPLVEESWTVILEGRRGRPPEAERAGTADPSDRWRRRLDEEGEGSRLAGLLANLLERLACGENGESLDQELDRRLIDSVEPRLRDRVLQEVSNELAPFRTRMSGECLEATRRRAAVDRLRRVLDLPRLASGTVET
jgi:hypothetical protein